MERYFLAGAIALLIVFFLTKIKHFEKEFGKLINIVGSLKFRVFEHEAQLLNRAGVYVPEDSAEFVFRIVWSMIDEKEKKFLESEYKQKCPSYIPMWKFVLYNYKLTTRMIPKEPLVKVSETEDLLSSVYEMEQITKAYMKNTENIQSMLERVKKADAQMEDVFKEINTQVKEAKDSTIQAMKQEVKSEQEVS